jgi:uncharacterized membrane protein
MTEQPVPAVHFATSLVPHRSLSPAGFRWLIWAAIAANLAIGLPMLIVGAWPVLGFMGLDIWLLWFLFKRSYLDARRSETLLLTDRELIIDRVAPDGDSKVTASIRQDTEFRALKYVLQARGLVASASRE